MFKLSVVIIGFALLYVILCTTIAFADADLTRLDEGGMKILAIVRAIGYWIILIKCIMELVKAAMEGDSNAIGKIIMTYVMIYGALFFVPWALRLVEGIF